MKFRAASFTCPFCLVNSQQGWHQAIDTSRGSPGQPVEGLLTGKCLNCQERTVWYRDTLVFPKAESTAPLSTDHMPDDVKVVFEEARNVLSISPRSACALLRLCIQKICIHKGQSGENLNKDIGNLVIDGLSPQTQKALDVVRVIGNNSVHPKDIIEGDTDEIARYMFEVVNSIVDDLFGREERLRKAYAGLPQSVLEAIERRDRTANIKDTVNAGGE